MDDENTWRKQDPELWDAITKGYGDGWWNMTIKEIADLEDKRVAEGKCPFCGKQLIHDDKFIGEVVLPHPIMPYRHGFCSEEHVHQQLMFYCIREGK